MPLKTPSPKQFWIIAAGLVCVAGLVGSGLYAFKAIRARPAISASEGYEPVVLVGGPNAKQKVTFVWAADEASRKFFQSYIRPIMDRSAKDSSVEVMLVQQPLDDKIDLRGPGSLLFCAVNQKEYGVMAYNYLTLPLDVTKRTSVSVSGQKYYVNDNITKLLEANNINLDACVTSKRFSNQILFYGARSISTTIALKNATPPLAILGGKRITPRDQKGLIELGKLAP